MGGKEGRVALQVLHLELVLGAPSVRTFSPMRTLSRVRMFSQNPEGMALLSSGARATLPSSSMTGPQAEMTMCQLCKSGQPSSCLSMRHQRNRSNGHVTRKYHPRALSPRNPRSAVTPKFLPPPAVPAVPSAWRPTHQHLQLQSSKLILGESGSPNLAQCLTYVVGSWHLQKVLC